MTNPLMAYAQAAMSRVPQPKPPVPEFLNVGDNMPHPVYGKEARCLELGATGDFPPRCARVKDHPGNHAAGDSKVWAVWA